MQIRYTLSSISKNSTSTQDNHDRTTTGNPNHRTADGDRGCRRATAALDRAQPAKPPRPLPAVRPLRLQRPDRRPAPRLPDAPAPRHRDRDLYARRLGAAPRFARQRRINRAGRRAVDDVRGRHHARRNAPPRAAGQYLRLPTVGQPASRAEDEPAALPGSEPGDHPHD